MALMMGSLVFCSNSTGFVNFLLCDGSDLTARDDVIKPSRSSKSVVTKPFQIAVSKATSQTHPTVFLFFF